VTGFGQDLVFAARLLRKSPAFTVSAVLTFALGIGVNVAVFSIVDAFVLRPLPVRDADRLVVVATERSSGRGLGPVSHPDLQDCRAATAGVLEDVAGYSVGFVGVAADGDRPARVLATWVTGNYFRSLDLRPALGRLFREDEGRPGRADAVVVLGHGSWQRRFHADPSVVGRPVRVNGRPLTIVGVAPPGFAGTFAFSESELFLPVNVDGGGELAGRDARFLHTLARLAPGVTARQAQTALDVVAARLAQQFPRTNEGVGLRVLPERLARPEEDNARTNALGATLALVMAGLVLVVAAANVAHLLLARAIDRGHELAVRAALGAGRGRLLRQSLTESLVLALPGGAAGVVLGAVTSRLLATARLPGDLPVRFDFHLDGRAFAFAAAVVLLAAAVAGAFPALAASRAALQERLREGGRGALGGGRAGAALVAAQVALSFVLLVAAMLLVRSLARAERADLGFRPEGVVNLSMDVGQLGYTEAQSRAFFAHLERSVRAAPGVEDASFAFSVPLGYVSTSEAVAAEGGASPAAPPLFAGMNAVGPAYFATLGIPILRGRSFDESDTERGRRVAIVNQRLAEELWPGEDPLGRRLRAGADGPWIEVVGVARTGKYRLLFEAPQPHFYVPLAQNSTGLRTLHVRTSLPPEGLAPVLERIVREREPQLALFDVQSMTRALGGGYGLFLVRVGALFAVLFGGLALALALVGLYGVASCAASLRTREIGVRMALGAEARDILGLVLGQGVALVGVGLAGGFLISLATARVLGGFLFGVSPRDPWTFACVGPILGAVAGVAYAIPALRAARVDPMVALREE
jgi:predicted permease